MYSREDSDITDWLPISPPGGHLLDPLFDPSIFRAVSADSEPTHDPPPTPPNLATNHIVKSVSMRILAADSQCLRSSSHARFHPAASAFSSLAFCTTSCADDPASICDMFDLDHRQAPRSN
ncbi:hypothetical protein PGTUg99_025038 [Puccinia graminis f. sp. tritici]|uniref:Uncharacterized protein n=1 Tax=Puccinia graminis f. sp. tritici TaxID=56615 RepID=A0A5B0N0I8_PUCGR|nr:hypothetical protein PGTUg99_025038 [Puccinia graminis f. sp. tritici]